MGTVGFVNTATSWIAIPGYAWNPLLWAEMCMRFGCLLLCVLAAIYLRRGRWIGVLCYWCYLVLLMVYQLFVIWAVRPENMGVQVLAQVVAFAAIFLPTFSYFQKRRPIFEPRIPGIAEPYAAAPEMPAQSAAAAEEEIQREEPAAPSQTEDAQIMVPARRKKYDTYYTCPNCGSLVIKGSYTCECGYVFRRKVNHKRIIGYLSAVLVSLALVIGGSYLSYWNGYEAGEDSQEKELRDMEQTLSEVRNERNDLRQKYTESEEKYDELISGLDPYMTEAAFLRNNIGFIVEDSPYYHNFWCDIFQDADTFWAHNLEYCTYLGYDMCPYCWN